MFGYIIDLPTLRSFEDALAHFKSITPIRGSELRPLCRTTNGRRKKHVQIVHSLHPAGDPMEAVACRLYNTDVITFYAGGDIVINTGGYANSTTHNFINAILWRRIHAHTQKGFTVISVYGGDPKSVYGGGPKAVLKAPSPKITIRLQNGEVCFPDTQAGFTAYYLKRAPYLFRQREIAPFRKFARACAKMVDPEDYSAYKGGQQALAWHRAGACRMHAYIMDLTKWNEALELLIPACMYGCSTYSGGKIGIGVNITKLDALLDGAIKYVFAEELFEVREAETPFSNNNYKYLGEGAL